MNDQSNTSEITIKKSNFTLESVINEDFIPDNLKDNLIKANILFIPKIIDNKPFFEIITQDLFAFLKENETENFKVDICIPEKDFRYIRTEAAEIFLSLGLFFIEEIVL
jgi:hypothetical protein